MPPHHCFLLLPGFPGKCDRVAVVGSPAVMAPQAADPARMGPLGLLLTAALLLAQVVPREASQHCGRLEYWNPDNRCCGSCLQLFGPPPCPDYEFSENCGLDDSGDHMSRPFKECPFGQCNPDSAELCSPCGGGATAPAPAGSRSRTQQRCPQRSIPPKEPCPLKSGKPDVLSSQDPSPSPISSLSWTSERSVTQAPWRHQRQGTHGRRSLWFHSWAEPLSRLLDELEVLEELIVLLDPEPGPGGGMACGTTRHLAARYGVPAAWSTFAYSLRPSRSPLRALIEMVVAREPSASLGQLGTHLAQLGRADALQVLSKLG
ncbi:IGF-like family receptor 1 isoform X3 [Lutra lutra]|uniref:IGF-like family receptor 1 isoform X3 n=1 Tax=Lutra lutra TaxID=9657 RepID=UPI001FD02C9F|nr:IGF-like family receptor 1 isoform X3 [Lutra lutra]